LKQKFRLHLGHHGLRNPLRHRGHLCRSLAEFGGAYVKAQIGAGQKLPVSVTVHRVTEMDKSAALDIADTDAVCRAIASMKRSGLLVRPMQNYYCNGGTPEGLMKKP